MLKRLYGTPDLLIHDYICPHHPATSRAGPSNGRSATAAPSREEHSGRHEIVFPRAGLYVKHVGRGRVLADVNQILFFNRGEPYRVSHPLAGGDRSTTIWMKDEDLQNLLSAFDPEAGAGAKKASARRGDASSRRGDASSRRGDASGRRGDASGRSAGESGRLDRPFARTHVPCPPGTALRHRRLLALLAAPGRDEVRIQEAVFDLLEEAIAASRPQGAPATSPLRPATRCAHRDIAFAAQTVLNERFHEPVTLRAIATAVETSPYHLCRIFRREIGSPLHRYLNRLRLRTSLERLADGEPDLTDLALSVGFSDHSHFTNAFRGEFGIPPSRFRALATTARIRQMSKNLQA